MGSQVTIIGLKGVPMVQSGGNLAALTLDAYAATGLAPEDGDVLVLAQKIVSRSEGRIVKRLGVRISDSFGRPFRRGTVGIALGAAGLPALIDWRGHPDLFGRTLEVTETGFADEIAAAASLVMGQADEAVPIALMRGLTWTAPEMPAAELVRPPEHDLFR